MKQGYEFRELAREALRGRWMIAVIAGLIALLLGAVSYNGPEFTIKFNGNDVYGEIQYLNQQIFSSSDGFFPELGGLMAVGMVYIVLGTLVIGTLYFILGSVVSLGYAKFNLDLLDRHREPEIHTLFAYFSYWKTAALAMLLQMIYILLYSLAFLIPGIMAMYSYAMTSYILAENPELTADEAIERSKEMMYGHRWRLFCMQFSFIGWQILCLFTFGLGHLFLTPYMEAATAVFYREVSGTEAMIANDNDEEELEE